MRSKEPTNLFAYFLCFVPFLIKYGFLYGCLDSVLSDLGDERASIRNFSGQMFK